MEGSWGGGGGGGVHGRSPGLPDYHSAIRWWEHLCQCSKSAEVLSLRLCPQHRFFDHMDLCMVNLVSMSVDVYLYM